MLNLHMRSYVRKRYTPLRFFLVGWRSAEQWHACVVRGLWGCRTRVLSGQREHKLVNMQKQVLHQAG